MVIVVKKVLKVLFGIFELILIIFVVFMTTCLLCRNKYNNTQFGDYTLLVVTEKNEKALSDFKLGDLVIMKQVKVDEVNIGDNLYYYVAKNKKYFLRKGGVIQKEGDIEGAAYKFDEEVPTLVADEKIVGEYSGTTYNGLGKIFSFLTSQVGFLIFVILPIMTIFIYHIYSLVILIKENKQQMARLKQEIEQEEKEQSKEESKPVQNIKPTEPLPVIEPMPSLDEIRRSELIKPVEPIKEIKPIIIEEDEELL